MEKRKTFGWVAIIDLSEKPINSRARTLAVGIMSSHVFPGKSGDEGSPHEGAKYCFSAGNDLIHPGCQFIFSISGSHSRNDAEVKAFHKVAPWLRQRAGR